MARSKSSSSSRGRDHNTITSDPLRGFLSPSLPRVTLSRPVVLLIEDRREWNPEPISPARSSPRYGARLTVDRSPARSQTKARVSFAMPNKVAVCVRRGVRREVLHALAIAGGKGFRKPRRGPYSSISCR